MEVTCVVNGRHIGIIDSVSDENVYISVCSISEAEKSQPKKCLFELYPNMTLTLISEEDVPEDCRKVLKCKSITGDHYMFRCPITAPQFCMFSKICMRFTSSITSMENLERSLLIYIDDNDEKKLVFYKDNAKPVYNILERVALSISPYKMEFVILS